MIQCVQIRDESLCAYASARKAGEKSAAHIVRMGIAMHMVVMFISKLK